MIEHTAIASRGNGPFFSGGTDIKYYILDWIAWEHDSRVGAGDVGWADGDGGVFLSTRFVKGTGEKQP